jgi:methylthioribose-1-phosphate isomerase
MKVKGNHFESIWLKKDDPSVVQIIDQRFLPFDFRIEDIRTFDDMYEAIRGMHVRGAPLIGASGALGMYLALINNSGLNCSESYISEKADYLKSSRPTAINLAWAIDRVYKGILEMPDLLSKAKRALEISMEIIDEERANCQKIGEYGATLIKEISSKKHGKPVNILTHCNAGWLACIDYGTATAPIYCAYDKGIQVHVWVDETRPRNQGARLTAWELQQHGVPCTVIVDNAGGYLMQCGMVDIVIVGSDRVSPYGDVVNKIGTYLKAIAAWDSGVPFYAALPSSSIDWKMSEGAAETPIEERNGNEVRIMEGIKEDKISNVEIIPATTPVVNPGFDITPARLVTGIITERGITLANKKSIFTLFPEKT